MAKLKLKTTMCVLRSILGEERIVYRTQRSKSWVLGVCAGYLPLTRSTAILVSLTIGVSLKWLLAGDISNPPTDSDGNPYTLESYQKYVSQLSNQLTFDELETQERFEKLYSQILNDYKASTEPEIFVRSLGRFLKKSKSKK
jgi:hypothetical protein